MRTALPLVVNTASNGLLGVVYWVVAARVYDQDSIARNLAVISAMTMLSGICQLNLGPGLAVFIPRAGSHARQVIVRAYGVVTGFTAFALFGFFTLVLSHLRNLSHVLNTPSAILLFAAAVLTLNLFSLQDAALVSLRWGAWIPFENTLFGVIKIVLLFAFASSFPELGIFLSWFFPMLLLVPVVSGLILRRRPQRAQRDVFIRRQRETLTKLALDYVGYLFQIASTVFLPVLALELLGAREASIFAIAWLTSSTLDLLATNIGTALTVETTYGEDPSALRRTMFRKAMPLVASVSLIGIAAAPLILRLYGAQYSGSGTNILQILLLASVPRALVTFVVAESRAHRNITFIVWLRAQNATVALGLALLLAPAHGPSGLAVGWLVAQLLGGANALWRVLRTRPTALA